MDVPYLIIPTPALALHHQIRCQPLDNDHAPSYGVIAGPDEESPAVPATFYNTSPTMTPCCHLGPRACDFGQPRPGIVFSDAIASRDVVIL